MIIGHRHDIQPDSRLHVVKIQKKNLIHLRHVDRHNKGSLRSNITIGTLYLLGRYVLYSKQGPSGRSPTPLSAESNVN